MKYLYILLLFICCFSVKAQDSTLIWKETIRNNYIQNENNLRVYYKRSAIPSAMKEALKKEHYGEFQIANASGEYNVTDVTSHSNRPFRKILFIVKNDNYIGLVYKYGGKASGTNFVFCELVDGKLKYFEEYSISHDIQTVDDLLSEVKKRNVPQ